MSFLSSSLVVRTYVLCSSLKYFCMHNANLLLHISKTLHYNGVATVVSLLLFVKWHIVCTLLHVYMTLYGNFLGVQLFE